MTEANALYYVADNISKQYKNSEGGTNQRNDAHFAELIAALAAIDFAWMTDLKTENGKPLGQPIYREFGIKNEAKELTFSDLEERTKQTIKKPMTQFTLFCKFLDEQIFESYRKQVWALRHKIDDTFIHSQAFSSDLMDIKKTWFEWLNEMANNCRAFAPFDLKKSKDQVFELIKDEKPYKSIFILKNNYELFDDNLNGLESGVKDDQSKPLQSFLELFFLATEKLVNSKFRM